MKFLNRKSLHYLFVGDKFNKIHDIALSIPTRNDTIIGALMKVGAIGVGLSSLLSGNDGNPVLEKNNITDNNQFLFNICLKFLPNPEILPIQNFNWYRWRLGSDTVTFKVWIGSCMITYGCTSSLCEQNLIEKLSSHIPSASVSEIEIDGMSSFIIDTRNVKQKNIVGHYKDLPKEFSAGNSYLLIGPPGNGKTSIVNNFLFDKKFLIIEDVDINYGFTKIVNLCKPEVLVIDDCDRIGADKSRLFITTISAIKEMNPNIVIILIANTFSGILSDEAMTRSKRIDKIIEVGNPTREDIVEILNLYFGEVEESIIDKLEGMSCADVEGFCDYVNGGGKMLEYFEISRDSLKKKYV